MGPEWQLVLVVFVILEVPEVKGRGLGIGKDRERSHFLLKHQERSSLRQGEGSLSSPWESRIWVEHWLHGHFFQPRLMLMRVGLGAMYH